MKKELMPYEKQIFVCTNTREGAACCGAHQADLIFQELRRIAKERGLHPKIRVAQAKCLGQCQTGVNIMVYPDNVWYKDVRPEHLPQLAQQYLSTT